MLVELMRTRAALVAASGAEGEVLLMLGKANSLVVTIQRLARFLAAGVQGCLIL